jgi:hypothetical protein
MFIISRGLTIVVKIMRFTSAFLFLRLASGLAVETRQTSTTACSEAMQLIQATKNTEIGGQLAYDCLTSMPFEPDRAKQFITELKKYIEFQSTLEALKQPPETYAGNAIDIIAGLDNISKITYSSQYQFDLDITRLLNSANDGHLWVTLCSTSIFRFYRKWIGLASVSKNGQEMPEIYAASDLKDLGAGSANVSPIKTINDQDAAEYLSHIAAELRYQDPDARWNALFVSDAATAATPVVEERWYGYFTNNDDLWPGTSNTRLGFKNGSVIDLPTYAQYLLSSPQTTGQDMYKSVCIASDPSGNPAVSTKSRRALPVNAEGSAGSAAPIATAGPARYPDPYFRDPYNQISGYNLDDETTVMLIPTFESGSSFPANQDANFALTASKIVEGGLASGRRKIIIDLSRNGGGNIVRGFDLFKLFFPSKFPYSGTRMRRHDATDLLAIALRDSSASEVGTSPWGWRGVVTPAQDRGFESLDAFLSGEVQLGVKLTSIFANFNYTAKSLDLNSPIRGFASAPINTTQPYKAEDIVIITDGTCTSTCTTFVNLMTNVGGVRALSFGGRPQAKPMQVMGGVRGAQAFQYTDVDQLIAIIMGHVVNSTQTQNPIFSAEQLARANATFPLGVKKLPLLVPSGGFNLRNAYQEGADHLPLQFEFQAADCRLFYTAQNVLKPETAWASAKAAIWGGGNCVEGSTGGRGSLEYRSKQNNTGGGQPGDTEKNSADRIQMGSSFLALTLFATAFATLM